MNKYPKLLYMYTLYSPIVVVVAADFVVVAAHFVVAAVDFVVLAAAAHFVVVAAHFVVAAADFVAVVTALRRTVDFEEGFLSLAEVQLEAVVLSAVDAVEVL